MRTLLMKALETRSSEEDIDSKKIIIESHIVKASVNQLKAARTIFEYRERAG